MTERQHQEYPWQVVRTDVHRDQRWNSFMMLIMAGLCFMGAVLAVVIFRQYFYAVIMFVAAVALCGTIAGERIKREKWAAAEQAFNSGAPTGPVVDYATPQKSGRSFLLRLLGIIAFAILISILVMGGIVLLLIGLCAAMFSGGLR